MTLPFSSGAGGHFSRSCLLLLFLPLSLCGLFFSTHADGREIQYLTAPEVKNMMDNDPRVVVINALSRIEYDGLHITGSINIPVISLNTTQLLPADRTTPLIFYCMGQE